MVLYNPHSVSQFLWFCWLLMTEYILFGPQALFNDVLSHKSHLPDAVFTHQCILLLDSVRHPRTSLTWYVCRSVTINFSILTINIRSAEKRRQLWKSVASKCMKLQTLPCRSFLENFPNENDEKLSSSCKCSLCFKLMLQTMYFT